MISDDLKNLITERIPTMEGWTSPERCIEMALLVSKMKPKVVVEIGVFGGRTFVSQALALKELGSGKIYGIDPWEKDAALEGENEENKKWWADLDINRIHNLCMESIWSLGLTGIAIPIRAASQFVHTLFPKESIDILFIDGNHSEIASTRDVHLYLPLVKMGGLVWFDDTDWPSTQSALRLMDEWCEYVSGGKTYRLYMKDRRLPMPTGEG